MRRFWSKEDDDFIINNVGKMTHREMAKVLERTPEAVQLRCYYKGLKVYNSIAKKKEIKTLYPHFTADKVAEFTGLTTDAVYKQAQRLRVKKYKETPYEKTRVYRLINSIV